MLTVLSGCSKGEHGLDPDNPVKITIWNYYSSSQKNAFDKLVDTFNATEGKELGIMVESLSQGGINELQSSLLSAANHEVGASQLPDMFFAYANNAQTMDAKVGLVDINTYLTGSEIKEYRDAYIEEGDVDKDGRILVFPVAKATEVLMINKTAWDEFSAQSDASVEDLKTWEGLAKTAEKYYEYSDGKAFFGRDAMANYLLAGAAQLGEDMFQVSQDGVKVNIDKNTIRTLWDNYYVPFVNGWYAKNGRYASDDVKTSDTIALVGSTSGATYFPTVVSSADNETTEVEGMVLPVPNFAGKDAIAIQQGAGVSIIKSDEAKEFACISFLRWFTEEERNLTFVSESAYLPVKTDIDLGNLEKEGNNAKQFVKDTVATALKQVDSSTLYTFDAFNGSSEVRTYLESSLQTKATDDKKAIDTLIAQGKSHDEAVSQYCTDENFNQWYDQFLNDIETIVESAK